MTGLLSLDKPLETPRLRLASLDPAALAPMMPWLASALAPEWSPADLEARIADGNGVLISDTDGASLGVAVVLRDVPAAGRATLPFLAVDPQRRFRGLGGEAGIVLSGHLAKQGFDRIYAPVPDGRGLAVYFWLRLGFRPLLQGESPGPVVGLDGQPMRGIWMESKGAVSG